MAPLTMEGTWVADHPSRKGGKFLRSTQSRLEEPGDPGSGRCTHQAFALSQTRPVWDWHDGLPTSQPPRSAVLKAVRIGSPRQVVSGFTGRPVHRATRHSKTEKSVRPGRWVRGVRGPLHSWWVAVILECSNEKGCGLVGFHALHVLPKAGSHGPQISTSGLLAACAHKSSAHDLKLEE